MDRAGYMSKVRELCSYARIGIKRSRGNDEHTTFIHPIGANWNLPVASVAVHHDERMIGQGDIEVWVYMYASFFNYRKIGRKKVMPLLLHAASIQGRLIERAYKYDALYNCSDGSVVLFKKIPLALLSRELVQISAFLI